MPGQLAATPCGADLAEALHGSLFLSILADISCYSLHRFALNLM